MTTTLVDGLSFDQAVEAVRAKAESMLRPGQETAIYTETGKRLVLVGVARPDHSCVLQIPVESYDARAILEITLGIKLPAAKEVGHGGRHHARR